MGWLRPEEHLRAAELEWSYFRGTPYYLAAHRSHNYYVRKDSAGSPERSSTMAPTSTRASRSPNGAWNAPLGDLVKYTAFLTNAVLPGMSRERYDVVLSRQSLEEMWQPGKPMSQSYESNPQQWMGLSFFIRDRNGQRILGHTGSQAGFRSFFYFDPKNGMAVIAAFNTTNSAAPASAAAAPHGGSSAGPAAVTSLKPVRMALDGIPNLRSGNEHIAIALRRPCRRRSLQSQKPPGERSVILRASRKPERVLATVCAFTPALLVVLTRNRSVQFQPVLQHDGEPFLRSRRDHVGDLFRSWTAGKETVALRHYCGFAPVRRAAFNRDVYRNHGAE